jgi:hypothetical protein
MVAVFRRYFHEPPQTQVHAALQLIALAVAMNTVLLEDGPHVVFQRQFTRPGQGETWPENGGEEQELAGARSHAWR